MLNNEANAPGIYDVLGEQSQCLYAAGPLKSVSTVRCFRGDRPFSSDSKQECRRPGLAQWPVQREVQEARPSHTRRHASTGIPTTMAVSNIYPSRLGHGRSMWCVRYLHTSSTKADCGPTYKMAAMAREVLSKSKKHEFQRPVRISNGPKPVTAVVVVKRTSVCRGVGSSNGTLRAGKLCPLPPPPPSDPSGSATSRWRAACLQCTSWPWPQQLGPVSPDGFASPSYRQTGRGLGGGIAELTSRRGETVIGSQKTWQ